MHMELKINFVDLKLTDADSKLLDASKYLWSNIPTVHYKKIKSTNITYLPIFIRTPYTTDAIWDKIPNDMYLLMQQSKIKPLIIMVTEQWDLFNTYAWNKNKFNITPDFKDIPYSVIIKKFTERSIAEENITWVVPHYTGVTNQIMFLKSKGYKVSCKFLEFDFFRHQIRNHTVNYKLKNKNFKKKYACLCQSKRIAPHRLGIIYQLFFKNILDQGIISCTPYQNIIESKRHNWINDQIDTDTFMSFFDKFKENKEKFLSILPINFDNKINTHFSKEGFDETYIFDNCFLWISNETRKEHDGIFITEKTWKSIAYGNPFCINGDNGSLDYLKSLGFKTFDKWWDESYDNDEIYLKIKKISNIIEMLCKKSTKEIESMYHEMLPVLKHNQELLQNFNGFQKLLEELNNG